MLLSGQCNTNFNIVRLKQLKVQVHFLSEFLLFIPKTNWFSVCVCVCSVFTQSFSLSRAASLYTSMAALCFPRRNLQQEWT